MASKLSKPGATVFQDSLLRSLVVVKHGGRLWIVPPTANGWAARMPLEMTVEARAERLRPAKDVTAAWLGVPTDEEMTAR